MAINLAQALSRASLETRKGLEASLCYWNERVGVVELEVRIGGVGGGIGSKERDRGREIGEY